MGKVRRKMNRKRWSENGKCRKRDAREREREMNRSVEAQSKSNSANSVSARPKAAQLDRDIGKTENYFII